MPPEIFDERLVAIRRERAERRCARGEVPFWVRRTAEDAADRISVVNRRFERALIDGVPGFAEHVTATLPATKCPQQVATALEDDQTYDLILSGLSAGLLDDLPGYLVRMRRHLRPDGLFIGCVFGGETLTELRRACFDADEAISGGFTPRVHPFADYSQAAALLQRAGLALPVVDTDRVSVRYKALSTLVNDLRDIGHTNALKGRSTIGGGASWRAILEAGYAAQTEGESFPATFEILWMTGWCPHDSQQKPLKPGSAQVSLTSVFGEGEA